MSVELAQAQGPVSIFTPEHLNQLKNGFESVLENHKQLTMAFSARRFRDARAEEFAHHGFLRRFNCMKRSIINVFTLLPPNLMDIPSEDRRQNAVINIQAFYINTYGATDNLSWIWVREKKVKKSNGYELPHGDVGLRKKNVIVSFPPDFREYLGTINCWFKNIENFRHALAHRIPLYIPPYHVRLEDAETYQKLENGIQAAMSRGDDAERDNLTREQEKIKTFQPLMTHSLGEKTKMVIFHSQLIIDFNTVHQIACKMLEALDR
ncbi:MAG: hypothetical protein KDE35_01415 [Geminicoccaceae bacterium]|nr:hypothetical protein [Geminicoccaceae bacterium]